MSDQKSDIDLTGMDAETAREYVLGFATTLKQLEREIGSLGDEAKLWRDRVALAANKGMAELKAGAEAKFAEITGKLSGLAGQREELASKVAAMKAKLPTIKDLELSVDTDQLLAELQLATGELLNPGAAAMESEMKKLEADAAAKAELDKLKSAPGA